MDLKIKKSYSIKYLRLNSSSKCSLLIRKKNITNMKFEESDSNGSSMEKRKGDTHCLNELNEEGKSLSVDEHEHDTMNFEKTKRLWEMHKK